MLAILQRSLRILHLLNDFLEQFTIKRGHSVVNILGVQGILFHYTVDVARIVNVEQHLVVGLCETLHIAVELFVGRLAYFILVNEFTFFEEK